MFESNVTVDVPDKSLIKRIRGVPTASLLL